MYVHLFMYGTILSGTAAQWVSRSVALPLSGTAASGAAPGGTAAQTKFWLVLQVLKVPLFGKPGWV